VGFQGGLKCREIRLASPNHVHIIIPSNGSFQCRSLHLVVVFRNGLGIFHTLVLRHAALVLQPLMRAMVCHKLPSKRVAAAVTRRMPSSASVLPAFGSLPFRLDGCHLLCLLQAAGDVRDQISSYGLGNIGTGHPRRHLGTTSKFNSVRCSVLREGPPRKRQDSCCDNTYVFEQYHHIVSSMASWSHFTRNTQDLGKPLVVSQLPSCPTRQSQLDLFWPYGIPRHFR
jgi:hypothetical protein